ncbi:hypothetical protein DV736_g5428, partial [Chaetothyriales sp. CBS 134916]
MTPSPKAPASPRTGLPRRGHSSRSVPTVTSHGEDLPPPHTPNGQERRRPPNMQSRPQPGIQNSPPPPETGFSHDLASIDAMRRKMSAAMAQKAQMKAATTTTTAASVTTASPDATPESPAPLTHVDSAHSATLSTDSARTVRPSAATSTPRALRTPSYPFPRMYGSPSPAISLRSGPLHKPFTLLSPTSQPAPGSIQLASVTDMAPSETSTPTGPVSPRIPGVPNDPEYATPDLYDVILMLNAEPGLDLWWANVTEILSDAFGAERASLALPGDMADIEKVPWGQKATFNILGCGPGVLRAIDSTTMSDGDHKSLAPCPDPSQPPLEHAALLQRPPLRTRHSIGGPVTQGSSLLAHQRPSAPVRAMSSVNTLQVEHRPSPPIPRLARLPLSPHSQSTASELPSLSKPADTASASSIARSHVHKTLQPLETEPYPLLVRTGVASLFGKRKSVVLTRAYSQAASSTSLSIATSLDSFRECPPPSDETAEQSSSLGNAESQAFSRRMAPSYDESEQPEPEPWSRSLLPSLSARPDRAESPFLAQPQASVDETTFEQNTPLSDYTASANQSLHPIGLDMSKSLVHIPLVLPVPTRGAVASTLRFPIAILSFLSPVSPYPRNLRHSLTHLLPHLASSFSMAQQYTNLLNRVTKDAAQMPASTAALGGTFSDESSELELVAELSGEIAHEKSSSPLAGTNIGSPPERTGTMRESAEASTTATPLHEYVGFSPLPQTPGGKSGSEMAEGYFTAMRHKGSHKPVTPGRTIDIPVAGRASHEKAGAKTASRRSGAISSRALTDATLPHSPNAGSPTSESDYGDATLLDRDKFEARRTFQHRESLSRDDGEKPLPELIASLMLNAVPLQLFLAKPTSGDLVWTNSKFDAFRSHGEGVVRDPWKNVHPEDRTGVVKLWEEAVKSGCQFTHYIRVKRFNNDSDSDFRWFVFRASTLMSGHSRLLYWIGSFLDVHEQYIKNLEASEREATMARDAKLRALADSIPQIMFEALEGDGIVSVNQQWQAYSGQTPEDSRGLGFATHVHREDLFKCGILQPSDKAPVLDSSSSHMPAPLLDKTWYPSSLISLDSMIKSGSVTVEKDENGRLSYLTEVRLRSRRGEYRWFLVRISRVESALSTSGRAAWYGTCTDIETRKALEHQLNLANEKVHSEMESKTKFFANMSHEIRTPLNGILGSMPWLLDSNLDHDQRRTVDIIQNSANNLRELVDNILDVTKVEAGKMALVPKWFHVRTLCEEVIDTVSSRAIERGLELNYTLEATVPTTVKADPFRVRQVLLNLLGNAVKFTEQGEVYMKCTARSITGSAAANPSALLCFEVVDTGRGFNESDFNRLFKRFGQLGTGTNHDAGSGLGLFLSKQLVEMHGGELSVQSQAGEGSTFSFFIRVDLAPAGTEVSSPPQGAAKTGDPLLRQPSSVSPSSVSQDSRTPSVRPKQRPIQKAAVSTSRGSPDAWSPSVDASSSIGSTGVVSPIPVSSSESVPSAGSNSSINVMATSGVASALMPTPESVAGPDTAPDQTERQVLLEKAIASHPVLPCSNSEADGNTLPPDMAHPATYSIVVICPAEHARTAIKQHIEHVVPLQIPVNVTTLPSIGAFLHLMNGPASPTFTHIVLDLPASSDIMLFMRQIAHFSAPVLPALVVVTDHYQKRDIQDDFQALMATGKKAFLIHKPVKPSVFAMIFDPSQLSNVSKDRAREIAQTKTDQFRKITNMVRETIGNRKLRVLLVEDSPVNRVIIVRYLNKVAIENDTAEDGQQCCDLIKGNPHGHYSLIICDIQMPRKNGYETCSEIRQWERDNHYPPLPIMALTANAMPEERSAAAAAGFTDYLTKPVDFNTLGRMMMTLLDRNVPHLFLGERPVGS